MTTNDTLIHIRSLFPLITTQLTPTMMMFNAGLTTGEISMAFKQHVINPEDYTLLNEEVREMMNEWHAKHTNKGAN